MQNVIYDIGVRMSFLTVGFAAGAGGVLRALGGLRSAAQEAESAVTRMGQRLNAATTGQVAAWDRVRAANGGALISQNSLEAAQIRYQAAQERMNALKMAGVTAGTAYDAAERQLDLTQLSVASATQRAAMATDRQAIAARAATEATLVQARAVTELTAAQDARALAASRQARGERGGQMLLTGGLVTMGGVMGARVIGHLVGQAAAFQTAMTGIALATGTGVEQLGSLQRTIFAVSGVTRFSAAQIADMAALAARSGLNSVAVLTQALPGLARSAEVAFRVGHIAPEESVRESVSLAHLFQAYPKTPAQTTSFNELVDLAARSLLVSGMNPKDITRAVVQLMPARAAFGLTAQDILSFVSLAGNVGLTMGGRGGAYRLAAIFRQLVPREGSRAQGAMQTIEQMGGGALFENGQLRPLTDVFAVFMRFMAAATQRQRMRLITDAFGPAAAQAIAPLATPGAMGRFSQIRGLLADPNGPLGSLLGLTPSRATRANVSAVPGVGGLLAATNAAVRTVEGPLASTRQMQETLNRTVQGQVDTLRTNLQNLGLLIGTELLPPLSRLLGVFVRITRSVVDFVAAHRPIAAFIGTFAAVAVAAALIGGPVLLAAGAFAVLSAAGLTLGLSFAPFTAIVLGVTAAVAGVTLAIQHWGEITRWIQAHLAALGLILAPLAPLIAVLGAPIVGVIALFTHLGQIADAVGGALGATWSGVSSAAVATWGTITRVMQGIEQAFGRAWQIISTIVGDIARIFGSVLGPIFAGVSHAISAVASVLSHVLAPAFAPVAALLSPLVTLFTAWLDLLPTLSRSLGDLAGTVLHHLGDAFGWAGGKIHEFLNWLGLLRGPQTTATPTVPRPGTIQPTTPTGTTVGLAPTLPAGAVLPRAVRDPLTALFPALSPLAAVPGLGTLNSALTVLGQTTNRPIAFGLPAYMGPRPAVPAAHAQTMAEEAQALRTVPLVGPLAAAEARLSSQYHVHVTLAPGAVVQHIHPVPGQNPQQIAARVKDDLAKDIADHIVHKARRPVAPLAPGLGF